MGLFSKGSNDGGKDTEGLPKRENKTERKASQAKAAQRENDSFSVPDRPGRPKGSDGYGTSGRD